MSEHHSSTAANEPVLIFEAKRICSHCGRDFTPYCKACYTNLALKNQITIELDESFFTEKSTLV